MKKPYYKKSTRALIHRAKDNSPDDSMQQELSVSLYEQHDEPICLRPDKENYWNKIGLGFQMLGVKL